MAVQVIDSGCNFAAEVRTIGNALVCFRRSGPIGTIKTNADLSC